MPWLSAPVLSAGASVLGGLFGSKGSEKSSTSSPWSAQQPYLQSGFAAGQTALDKAQAMGDYQGNYTADMNPYQTQGLNGTAAFGSTSGMGAAQSMLQAGQAGFGSAQQYGANAQSMYDKFGQDPTQQITNNAAQYAANPYLDGQIDAASRDVSRNLYENQLTGLDNSASGTGNMNSSRTGVAQGVMQRGAADQIGDISSQMRGAAYNNGLGMAQSQYNTNGTMQMNANGQNLNAANYGLNTINSGLNAGYGANTAITGAGQGFQTQDQNTINGNIAQFSHNQNSGLDLVGKYMQSVGGNFGQSTTGTSGGGLAGAAQGALSAGTGIAGVLKTFATK